MTSGKNDKTYRTRELKRMPTFGRKNIDLRTWRLKIEGEVLQPKTETLRSIKKLPTIKLSKDFKCLEGWVVKNVLWEGVPVSNIVPEENLKAGVKFLLFCSGNYSTALSLRKAFRKTTILALKKSNKQERTSWWSPQTDLQRS
jgi:DMSO/TMAO reductase YedYZ molybdopterin-dependent catalytic subunit